jgi:tetratricopeptide (TPR) repeat protein
MIDITRAKADAEEGLRIAEPATKGPWHKADCVSPKIVIYAVPQGPHGFGDIETLYLGETYCDTKGQGRANLAFIADSRTRAPEAYRNVIEMAGVIDNLNRRLGEAGELYGVALFNNERLTKERDKAIASYNRSIANREQDLAEFRALSARVTAAELAEEKMTRKAEEHYDRAVKAEAERDALRLDVVRLRSENEKHLEQSWAFETEIEQLREQLDKYVDVKFAKDVS